MRIMTRAIAAVLGLIIFWPATANATFTVPVVATGVNVQVVNASHHSVWVDLSTRVGSGKWTIDRAFCMNHATVQEHTVHTASPIMSMGVRVRAELKRTDCKSSNVRVLEASEGYSPTGLHHVRAVVGPTQLILQNR